MITRSSGRIAAVSFTLITAFLIGLFAAELLPPTSHGGATVYAQPQVPPCMDDCEFGCSNEPDAWYDDLSGTGVWLIVHAKPVYKNGAGVDQATFWHDPSPEQFPPMEVKGYWREKAGTDIQTFTMTLNDAGVCDDTYSGGHIRCHDGADEDDTVLCDGYTGNWERIAQGSSGAAANCLTQFDLGYDFKQEIEYGGEIYCFVKAEVKAIPPDTTGLKGRMAGSSCPGSTATWDTTRNANTLPVSWTCAELDETRPDLTDVGLDITLNYYYR